MLCTPRIFCKTGCMRKNESASLFFGRVLAFGFFCHDSVAGILSRYYSLVKHLLLAGAYLVLSVFFLPIFPVLQKNFGEAAGNLLIVILFLSPLATLFRMRLLLLLMGLRRELGILMGCLALVHGVGYLVSPSFFREAGRSFLEVGAFSWERGVVAGMIGLLLLLPLLLTSNNFSVRFLGGKSWKRLHRLVYPAFFFIVFHRFFMGEPQQSVIPFLLAVLLIGAYSALKFLAWRPGAFPWLQERIGKGGVRYRHYRDTPVSGRTT